MTYSIEEAEVSDICKTVLDEVVRTLARTLGVFNQNTIVAIAFEQVVEDDYGQKLGSTPQEKRWGEGKGDSGHDK